jgi:Domain of unknown function (DUF4375)
MPDDEDEDDEVDDDEVDDDEVDDDDIRKALRALRSGTDVELGDVLTLAGAADAYTIELVPAGVTEALDARFALARDVANGGLDQFAWNHGADTTRAVANALRTVGAIENADVLDRLAAEVAAYLAAHTDVSDDPVRHFLAYRRAVSGPEFGIPEPDAELAEVLVEYVLERAEQLPDPDGPLPRRE